MNDQKIEKLLLEGMHTDRLPSQELIHRVKLKMLVNKPGRAPHKAGRTLKTLALASALMLVFATSVYAVVHLIQASRVAETAGDHTLAAAFSTSGIKIFSEKEAGDYRFTLTEMVRGADITDLPFFSFNVTDSRLYILIAIERLDGAPMQGDYTFIASPLIKGFNPVEHNVFSMNSATTDVLHDGILYRLLSCDDIAIFADHGLNLVICEDTFLFDAIQYNAQSGIFTLNPGYTKTAVLFELPIPAEYADTSRAAEYWDRQQKEEEQDVKISIPDYTDIMKLDYWDDAQVVKGSKQELVIDKSGYYTYIFGEYAAPGYVDCMILASELRLMMEEEGNRKLIASVSDDGTGTYWAVLFEMDDNGVVTGTVLQKNQK